MKTEIAFHRITTHFLWRTGVRSSSYSLRSLKIRCSYRRTQSRTRTELLLSQPMYQQGGISKKSNETVTARSINEEIECLWYKQSKLRLKYDTVTVTVTVSIGAIEDSVD